MSDYRYTMKYLLVPLAMVGSACLAAALVAFTAPASSGPNQEETIRARKFIVVDDTGKDVGEFGYEQGTVRVRIPSDPDKPAVWLGTNGPLKQRGLVLLDERGQPRMTLASCEESGIGLTMHDEKGDSHVSIGLKNDELPTIWAGAGRGKAGVSINVDEHGRPAIDLADGKDHRRALIYLDSEGVPGMAFFEEDGKTVVREIRPDEK